MSADDDFPVLDIDMPSEDQEEASSNDDHVVGPPPSSGYSEYESEENFGLRKENMGSRMPVHTVDNEELYSGDDEFDVDAYEKENFLEPEPTHALPVDSVLCEANSSTGKAARSMTDVETEAIPQSMDILKRDIQHLLSSTLMCQPLKVRDGYTPDELDSILRDNMEFCLQSVTEVYLEEDALKRLPNPSKTEYALALARAGWLTHKGGRFFPVISEKHSEMVTSIIVGAENLSRFEEKKKKEAHEYDSEEQEIRALRTFNMIAELLNSIRNEHETREIQYQLLAHGYELMVTGRFHEEIYEKYKKWLPLESDKLWNPKWFNEYTKRSSLKKFLTGSRFSEIVVGYKNGVVLYFRADDEEKDRPVRLFTDADMEDVRQKWQKRDPKNKNIRDYNRGSDEKGPSLRHKRQVERDPNFRPATLTEEDVSGRDDGSLLPTPLSRLERNGQLSAKTQRIYEAPSSVAPFEHLMETGDTSSDGVDISSDGSYSNEELEVKEARKARRTERKKKNEEKEQMKRQRHRSAANAQNHSRPNRFRQYIQRATSPRDREIERTPGFSSKETVNISSPAQAPSSPLHESEHQAQSTSAKTTGITSGFPALIQTTVLPPKVPSRELCMPFPTRDQEHCNPHCSQQPSISTVNQERGETLVKRQEQTVIKLADQMNALPTEQSCVSYHLSTSAQHPYLMNNAPIRPGVSQLPQFREPNTRNGFGKNLNMQAPQRQTPEYCGKNSELAAASPPANLYNQGQAPAHQQMQQTPSFIHRVQEQQYQPRFQQYKIRDHLFVNHHQPFTPSPDLRSLTHETTYSPYDPCERIVHYEPAPQCSTAGKSSESLNFFSRHDQNAIRSVNNEQIISQIIAIMYECNRKNCIVTESVLLKEMQHCTGYSKQFNVRDFVRRNMSNVIRIIDDYPELIFLLNDRRSDVAI